MRSADLGEFMAVMRDTRDAIGQGDKFTDGALELIFAALAEFDMKQIQQALVDHMNGPDGKWRPSAHYVRAQIQRKAGAAWIDADEAYTRIPKPGQVGTRIREHEYNARVPDFRAAEWPPCLLNQAAEQAIALVAPILERERPDENQARMAFRACYNRVRDEHIAAGKPPIYRVSPGGTHEERQVLTMQGIEMGLLPAPKKAAALALEYTPPSAEFRRALAGFKPKIIDWDGVEA